MGHEQELIPGQIMKWVMFRPSLKLSYGEEQDVHPHHKFAYLKQLLQKLSKRSRMRLIQFLKMPLKGGMGRCTFIYDAGDQKSVVIFLEVNEVSSSECFGTVQIKSIIPSSVDTEWILMSLLKDTRKSVIIADQDLNIVCVNQYLLNHFDVIESDVVGQALSCLSCDSHANETFKDLLQEAHAGEDSWGGVVDFCKHNGDVTTHDVDIKKLYWCTDTLLYIIRLTEMNGLQLNLSPQKDEHWQDVLEMPDKLQLIDQLGQGECKEKVLLVACIKPDFFKSVREEANKRLSLALKKLSMPLVMGRVDDGVYCIVIKICPNYFKDTHAVPKILRKLRKELKSQVHDLIFRDIVNGLWGIDIHGADGAPIEVVVDRAIQTMNVHDRRKSPYAFFNQKLIEDANREQKQVSVVLEAVRLRTIDVAYQPIIDLKTGKIHRFEALCRFGDVTNLFSVQELINTAEKLGVVHVLDKIVAEKALLGFARIQSKFSAPQNLSLNCSLVETDEKLKVFDDLCNVINQFKPKDCKVTVEITESAYFDNSLMESPEVIRARKSGIDIAVDDFGSGNSSFQYFNNIRFDCIKIDKSFISDIDTIRHKYLAVKMLTELAHELQVKVVVEGVESYSELRAVQTLKVDYVQGFYFSRPRSLQDIVSCNNLEDLIANKQYAHEIIVIS